MVGCILILVVFAAQSVSTPALNPDWGAASKEVVSNMESISESLEKEYMDLVEDDIRMASQVIGCFCVNLEIRICPSTQTFPIRFPVHRNWVTLGRC